MMCSSRVQWITAGDSRSNPRPTFSPRAGQLGAPKKVTRPTAACVRHLAVMLPWHPEPDQTQQHHQQQHLSHASQRAATRTSARARIAHSPPPDGLRHDTPAPDAAAAAAGPSAAAAGGCGPCCSSERAAACSAGGGGRATGALVVSRQPGRTKGVFACVCGVRTRVCSTPHTVCRASSSSSMARVCAQVAAAAPLSGVLHQIRRSAVLRCWCLRCAVLCCPALHPPTAHACCCCCCCCCLCSTHADGQWHALVVW
jgi:hypothetical protein